MLNSFGYEVLVQPALYAAAGILVLWVLFRGSHREQIVEDGVTRKGKRQFQPKAKRYAFYTLIGTAALLPGAVITPPGHMAAIYSLGGGVSPDERPEGLSFVVPWVQTARMVSVRTHVYEVEVYPQTKDLQEVTVPVAVNHHVSPEGAAEIYQSVGLAYEPTVIRPAVLQLVTQEVGQFLAEDFAQNRAALAQAVQTALESRLAPYGIVVESVNVEDAVFDPDFILSVKQKVIADQEAAEQERLVAAETHKANQAIAAAKGAAQARIEIAIAEQQAIELVAAALGFTPTEYLEWVRLGKWDGALPSTVVGGSAESLIFDVGAAE